jgi:hypothetical protein
MDSETPVDGGNNAANSFHCVPATSRGLSWSIAALIRLLDDAIDSAGAQLARSAGLWADSPDELSVFRAPDGRRAIRSRSLSALDLLEEAAADRVIETP